nr:MAG TPA: hypothetical protein [Caudoviricetes sp.]
MGARARCNARYIRARALVPARVRGKAKMCHK